MDKTPPNDPLAEQAVISSCLIDPSIVPMVGEMLTPADYHMDKHTVIYKAITELGDTTNAVTLVDNLTSNGNLEKAGGKGYIFELIEKAPVASGWKSYAEIVKKHSVARQTIFLCTDAYRGALNPKQDPILGLGELLNGIGEIQRSFSTPETTNNKKMYTELYDEINSPQTDPGMTTGIECIDSLFYLEPECSHVIAAESGVGKSAICLQIADHVAEKYGPVLYFSMESTRKKLGVRQIARYGQIPLTRLNKHNVNEEREQDLQEARSN